MPTTATPTTPPVTPPQVPAAPDQSATTDQIFSPAQHALGGATGVGTSSTSTTTPNRTGGGGKPGGSKPGGSKPGGNKPGGSKPGGSKPGGSKPGGNKPGGNKPGGNKPGGATAGATGTTAVDPTLPGYKTTAYDTGAMDPTQTAVQNAANVSNLAGENSRRTRRVDALQTRIDSVQRRLQNPDIKPRMERKLLANLPALKQQLNAETTMAYLARMARDTGASGTIIGILNRASIGVVPDGVMESDGSYDPKTNTIYISQGLLKQTMKDVSGLLRDGVLDPTTGVKHEKQLMNSDVFHNLVATQALFAHEGIHGKEDAAGALKAERQAFQPVIDQYQAAVAAVNANTSLSDAERQAQLATLENNFITNYATAFERDEYYVQERYQINQGETPTQHSLLTVDANGTPLSDDQAGQNIAAFMKEMGFSAADVIAIFNADANAGAQPGGWHPGDTQPGGWHPGQTQPGGWHPGGTEPGGWHPGGWHPGGWHPGGWHPGFAFWDELYANALGVANTTTDPTQQTA